MRMIGLSDPEASSAMSGVHGVDAPRVAAHQRRMRQPRVLPALLLFLAAFAVPGARSASTSITYPAGPGPGAGRHLVFLTGDEEYRGEEGLPMLAKILSQRHGFRCTVPSGSSANSTVQRKPWRSTPPTAS